MGMHIDMKFCTDWGILYLKGLCNTSKLNICVFRQGKKVSLK